MLLKRKSFSKQRFLVIVLCLTIPSILTAQYAITSAGNTKVTSTVQISYTLGESFVGTFTTGNNSLAQGLQVGHIQRVSIDEISNVGLKINLTYEPSNESIRLIVDEDFSNKLTAKITDTNGRVISASPILQRETEIPCGLLPSAMYLMHIYKNSKKVQSYKIQVQ